MFAHLQHSEKSLWGSHARTVCHVIVMISTDEILSCAGQPTPLPYLTQKLGFNKALLRETNVQ